MPIGKLMGTKLQEKMLISGLILGNIRFKLD